MGLVGMSGFYGISRMVEELGIAGRAKSSLMVLWTPDRLEHAAGDAKPFSRR
jgi:hypothetical protein